MKRTMIVWSLLMVILIGGLTYIGFNLTSKNKDFYVKENLIKEAAIEYFNHYPDKLPPKEAIVKKETLEKEGFLDETNLNCEGFVRVVKNIINYDYTGFIKCINYETKNYDKVLGENI